MLIISIINLSVLIAVCLFQYYDYVYVHIFTLISLYKLSASSFLQLSSSLFVFCWVGLVFHVHLCVVFLWFMEYSRAS